MTDKPWTKERLDDLENDLTRSPSKFGREAIPAIRHLRAEVERLEKEREWRPAGWRLVPETPTEAMLAAGNSASLSTSVLLDDQRFACERATYEAAVSTAPVPPGAEHE